MKDEKDKLKIFGMHVGASPSVFRNAVKLREKMTAPEKKLWEYLKTKPMGYKFRRQHPITGYVLDFYCHKLRLSIEIDGDYHLKKERIEKDKIRTDHLAELGIHEIRFTNEQVLSHYEKVFERVNILLRADTPLGAGGERGQEKNKTQ